MSDRPRSPEFRRLGAVRPTELDLPTSKARTLLLEGAWRRIAGDAIVLHSGSVVVRRGVLEVRCHHRSWKGALLGLLPRLARALATECPELSLVSWRLIVDGEEARPEAAPILSLVDARPAASAAEPPATKRESKERENTESTASPAERLQALKERYLEVRKPPRP